MRAAVWTLGLVFLSAAAGDARAAELGFSTNEFATHYNRTASSKGLKGGLALAGCNVHGEITSCSYPVSNVLRMTAMGSSAKARARGVYLEFTGETTDERAMTDVTIAAAAMAWTITPNFSGAGNLMIDLLNDTSDKPSRTVGQVVYEVEVEADGKVWFKARAR